MSIKEQLIEIAKNDQNLTSTDLEALRRLLNQNKIKSNQEGFDKEVYDKLYSIIGKYCEMCDYHHCDDCDVGSCSHCPCDDCDFNFFR